MIEQNVQVVRCQEERLWVRMGSQSGCTACDNGKGCGAGLFAKLLQRKPVVLELPRTDMNVKAGQMVTLSFSEKIYLKLVLASYGWPLLAALGGAFAGFGMSTWLQLGPMLIDLGTLTGALFFGWVTVKSLKSRAGSDNFLKSLHATCYSPSTTPEMCNGKVKHSQTT
jgi:sigma-E factor negative regulatory protein RseC